MSDFIKVISESAPFAMLGAILAGCLGYLQMRVAKKEQTHRLQENLRLEVELRKQIEMRELENNELRKQLAKLAATGTRETEAEALKRLENELSQIRERLARKEGQQK
jgi:predicted nuclease with TOPRIM domain